MNIQIYFIEITGKTNFQMADFLKLIPTKKQEKLCRYRFLIDVKLSLYAELLIRLHVKNSLGLNNSKIEFGLNKYGKPFLKSNPGYHFNISHTRNAIVVAFSDSEIGIDVEKVQPFDHYIEKELFTSFECNFIYSNKDPDRAFYEVWTRKEAYLKYLGTGLNTSLKSFNVLNPVFNTLARTHIIGEYIFSIYSKDLRTKIPSIIILTESELTSLIVTLV